MDKNFVLASFGSEGTTKAKKEFFTDEKLSLIEISPRSIQGFNPMPERPEYQVIIKDTLADEKLKVKQFSPLPVRPDYQVIIGKALLQDQMKNLEKKIKIYADCDENVCDNVLFSGNTFHSHQNDAYVESNIENVQNSLCYNSNDSNKGMKRNLSIKDSVADENRQSLSSLTLKIQDTDDFGKFELNYHVKGGDGWDGLMSLLRMTKRSFESGLGR